MLKEKCKCIGCEYLESTKWYRAFIVWFCSLTGTPKCKITECGTYAEAEE